MKKYYALMVSLFIAVLVVAGVRSEMGNLLTNTSTTEAQLNAPSSNSTPKKVARKADGTVSVKDIAGKYTYEIHLKNAFNQNQTSANGSLNINVADAAENKVQVTFPDPQTTNYTLTLWGHFNPGNNTLTLHMPMDEVVDDYWQLFVWENDNSGVAGDIVFDFNVDPNGNYFLSTQKWGGCDTEWTTKAFARFYYIADYFKISPDGWELNLGGSTTPDPTPDPDTNPDPSVNVTQIAGEYTYSYRNIDAAGNVLGEGSVKFIVGVSDLSANKVSFTYEEPCLGYVVNGYANFDPETLTLTFPSQPMYEFINGWFTLARMNEQGGATEEGDIVLQYQDSEDGGYFISTQKYCADEKWKVSTGNTGFRNEVNYYFRRDIFRITPDGWKLNLGGSTTPDPTPNPDPDPDPTPGTTVTVNDIAGEYVYSYHRIKTDDEGSIIITLAVVDEAAGKVATTFKDDVGFITLTGTFDATNSTITFPCQMINDWMIFSCMGDNGKGDLNGSVVLSFNGTSFISTQEYVGDDTQNGDFRGYHESYIWRDRFELTPNNWTLNIPATPEPAGPVTVTVNDIAGNYTYSHVEGAATNLTITVVNETTNAVTLSYDSPSNDGHFDLNATFDPATLKITIPYQLLNDFGNSTLNFATYVDNTASRDPLILNYHNDGNGNGYFESTQGYVGVVANYDGSFTPGFYFIHSLFRIVPQDGLVIDFEEVPDTPTPDPDPNPNPGEETAVSKICGDYVYNISYVYDSKEYREETGWFKVEAGNNGDNSAIVTFLEPANKQPTLSINATYNEETQTLSLQIPLSSTMYWGYQLSLFNDSSYPVSGTLDLKYKKDNESDENGYFVTTQHWGGYDTTNNLNRVYMDVNNFVVSPDGWVLNLPYTAPTPDPDPNPGEEPAIKAADIAGTYSYEYVGQTENGKDISDTRDATLVASAQDYTTVTMIYVEPALGYTSSLVGTFDPENLTITFPGQRNYEKEDWYFDINCIGEDGKYDESVALVLTYDSYTGSFVSEQKYGGYEVNKASGSKYKYYECNLFRLTPKGFVPQLGLDEIGVVAGDKGYTLSGKGDMLHMAKDDANATWYDATAVEGATTVNVANTNALMIVNADHAIEHNANEVIRDENGDHSAEALTIDDAKPFSHHFDIDCKNISYSRANSKEFITTVLPFSVTTDNNMYRLTGATLGEEKNALEFSVFEETVLPAYTPMMIHSEAADLLLNGQDVVKDASSDPYHITPIEGMPNWYTGYVTTYTEIDNVRTTFGSYELYCIEDDQFVHATGSATIMPFRVFYLYRNAINAPARFAISVNPYTPSGIEGVNVDKDDAPVYDLQGRPVAPGFRGIVVKDGQKVIIK